MAALDLSNPQHPTFNYTSDGMAVSGGVVCNCTNGDQTCLDRCAGKAQKYLDAALIVFPED